MIIYQATKREFLHHALADDIEDVVSRHDVHATGHRVGPAGAPGHSISDPETGGSYTIKRYRSEKVVDADGGWQHTRIELMPESDQQRFEVITVEAGDAEEQAVVAEWLIELTP